MNLSEPITRRTVAGLLFGGALAAASGPAFADTLSSMSVPYTGVDAIDILVHDHERIHRHLNKLIDDVPSRTATLRELGVMFTVHNATEENFIYPAIAVVAERSDDAWTLFHQQDEAKVVVWKLNELLSMHPGEVTRFTESATKFRIAVLEHVAQEQNIDFPKLREALGSVGLARVTAQVRAFRNHFA